MAEGRPPGAVSTIRVSPLRAKREKRHEPLTLMKGGLVEVVPPNVPSREAWMLQAVEELRPLFAEAGAPIPEKVRVSVGWPGGRGKKQGVVGQCWARESVADGIVAIFVSPVRVKPLDVLETLTHELVHATGVHNHKGPFAKLGAKVGLVGAPAWTGTAIHPAALERFQKLAEKLGAYDHATINPGEQGQVVQSTRMLKVQCPDCGCVVRMTRKWIDEAGTPTCGCGSLMEEALPDLLKALLG